jgi:hypothetical protein
MAAQGSADDFSLIGRNSTQSRVPLEKSPDRLAIVPLRNVETFDAIPQFNRGVIVVDAKFVRLNLHCAERQRTSYFAFGFGFFVASRSAFRRLAARFLILSLPRLCPIRSIVWLSLYRASQRLK